MTPIKYYVYKISHPADKSCFWVGMTTDPHSRFTRHMCSSEGPTGEEKLRKIKSILAEGLFPEFTIIFWTIAKNLARIEEARTIGELQSLGHPILNVITELSHTPMERKPVKDNNGVFYTSVLEASKKTGCSRTSIRNTIRGNQDHTKGLKFSWATPADSISKEKLQ